MRHYVRTLVVLLLAVVLMLSTGLAAEAAGPGKADMEGCDKRVAVPDAGSWLSRYETKVVQGTKKGSTAVYLRFRPEKDGAARGGGNHQGVLYNGTEVTVLARQSGYSLVKVKPGYVGWVPSSGLVDKASVAAPAPEEAPASADEYPTILDLEGCDEALAVPRSDSWLAAYEYMTVQGQRSSFPGTVLRLAPVEAYTRNGENYLGVEYNDTPVTALARQDDFTLVLVEPGYAGWVSTADLAARKDVSSDTPAPTPTAPTSRVPRLSGKPGTKDMAGCDEGVVTPESGSWLKAYEYKLVQGTKKASQGIILRQAPSDHYIRNQYNYLGTLYNGTEVAVLARQGGYSLVMVEPGYVGWVPSKGLVNK